MKGKDHKYVQEIIEQEGFNEAFMDYSDFEEVEDAQFHQLRKEYIDAANRLKEYVG